MPFGVREGLALVVAIFVIFLVAKLRPGIAVRGGLGEKVREARARASSATDPRGKAEALCEAGRLAAEQKRWTSAAGFFLRAMNAEPSSGEVVAQAVLALATRRRLLERILLRRLANVPWDAAHASALRAAAVALSGLYDGRLRDRARAEVYRRLAERIG